MGVRAKTPESERRAKRSRLFAVIVSVALHMTIPLVMLSRPPNPPLAEPPPLMVTLYEPPPPPPPAPVAETPAGPAEPAPSKAPPRPNVRPPVVPPPPTVEPLRVNTIPEPEPPPLPELSAAQLAGARTAGAGSGAGAGGGSGSGGGGQPCDMVRRLQTALRGDADVRAAVAEAHRARSGKAMLVWNGDWIRNPGQEGKGLAGVRQAIVMEVAFAPDACRTEPVDGLVLISMNDGPGAPRLVLGSGRWRWADLLAARRR